MPSLIPTRAFRRPRERVSGLLFAFGVDEFTSSLPTGQSLTVTRGSPRTVYDTQGRVATIAHSQPPWSSVYNAQEGLYEPMLAIEGARSNKCLYSEDFSGASWSAIGTPTRSAARARCGDVVLDLIGDDASGTLEGYSQVVTLSGAAVKTVSFFIKQGTSTSSVVRFRDTTAATNRLLATITWSSGVPSVAITTGVYITAVPCAGGVYRLLFQTTSATAANSNQVELYPATTSALVTTNTGDLLVGGVQVEDSVFPKSYNKTTSGTFSQSGEVVTAAIAWPLQALTVYARIARPTWAGLSGTLFSDRTIVNWNNGGDLYKLQLDAAARTITSAVQSNAGTLRSVSASIPSTSFIDIVAQFKSPTTGAVTNLDVGSGPGADSTATGVFTAMGTTLYIGSISSGGNELDGGIRKLLIASGARTLAEMRGLNV